MRTISPEQRLVFLAKAHQQKAEDEASASNPLSQLLVEDDDAKEGRRKRKADRGRISLQVPNKGEVSTASTAT
ncbi:hypothetical protein A2U01_0075015, partial [Trifolium medium]|nr:hypothetical protein [Trifolium medium]